MIEKICLFGDSIAKGIIIDEVLGKYTVTKSSFANILSLDKRWSSIKNFSMLGCTIAKGRSLIARHIKSVENCDMVILEYGGNDSDHHWDEISQNPDLAHSPKTPIEDFAKDYRDIISGLKAMSKKIVMLNLPPIDHHKYFNWFCQNLNKMNILRWLGGSEENIYKFHESYSICVSEIAADENIPLVDIRSGFLALGAYTDHLCADGIHPNEKGHRLIARIINDKVPSLVAYI